MDGPWRQCGRTDLHDPHTWDTLAAPTDHVTLIEKAYCPGLDGHEHERATDG